MFLLTAFGILNKKELRKHWNEKNYNILLSRLKLYLEEIVGDHQCVF
jgi:hypothetical protein